MPAPRLVKLASRALAALVLTALLLAGPAPDASAATGKKARAAERVVESAAKRRTGLRPAAGCKRIRRARKARAWVCRWRVRKAGRSCVVRQRVTRKKGRWKLGRRARRCRRQARQSSLMFGFNDYSVRPRWATAEQSASLTADVGADVSRVGVSWRYAEPVRGRYLLGDYDDIYREMQARGVRPVWTPMFAPDWATETGRPCNGRIERCHYPPARRHISEYAAFAAELARRYPGSAAIEIWNEPNYSSFWEPGPDVDLYADLVKATYRAVKAANPSMTVIGGGLADSRDASAGMGPGQFARAMFDRGLAAYMDGFAFHPYPHGDGYWERTFAEIRAAKRRAGAAKMPLWITETGFTTSGRRSSWPSHWIFSEAGQAQRLVSLYRRVRAMPDVKALMVHTLVEPEGDPQTSAGVGYGVVRQDLSVKPAYCALARERGRARSPRCP